MAKKTVSGVYDPARRGSGLSRRTLVKGALATSGFLFGSGAAPALAQARRDLRIGVFGGGFCNFRPPIPAHIQGGLIPHNLFNALTDIDYQSRDILSLAPAARA